MITKKDKEIIIEFAKKYDLTSVILFGSSLSSSKAKDIDIGIKGIKPESFFDFYWDIYSRLSRPVDVINLRKKNRFNLLIEKSGLTLYEKSNS